MKSQISEYSKWSYNTFNNLLLMEINDRIKVIDVDWFTESYLCPLLSVFYHVEVLNLIWWTPWSCIQIHVQYEINSFQSLDLHISFLLLLGHQMLSLKSRIQSVLGMMRMKEAKEITVLVFLFDCLKLGALSIQSDWLRNGFHFWNLNDLCLFLKDALSW